MCLILEVPADADPISFDEYLDVSKSNPDGLCVLRRSGELLYRGCDLVEGAKHVIGAVDVVIHWRKATHGTVDVDRCHGWEVGEGVRLLHNGVLPGAWGDRVRSDTSHLVEVLQSLQADLSDPAWDPLLAAIAGSSVVVITGREAAPTWLREPEFRWKGRAYSNRYAWSASVHGVPPPPIVEKPAAQYVAGYLWAEDGAWMARRGKRGR